MEKITNSAELTEAIQLLEIEKYVSGQELKKEFFNIFNGFHTGNIIKSVVKEVVSSPFIIENILGSVISLATGYFSNKLFIGVSGKLFGKLFGSYIQSTVKSVFTRPPSTLKSIGQTFFQNILHKKY